MRSLVLVLPLLACACSTTIAPTGGSVAVPDSSFSHRLLDDVLGRVVDHQGRVDYAGLQRDPADLDAYYALLARVSPDSHPHLFDGDAARLAYWINAYNAAVLKAVLTHYPITSVSDVAGPPLSGLFSEQIGFFYFQKLLFGGRKINLYDLEHEVIRGRFTDPRIHFAVNCASVGCPRLPTAAFRAERLTDDLQREAVRFLNEERNLRLDAPAKVVHLSSILVWYRDDYLAWLRERHPEIADPDLLDYVLLFLRGSRRSAVEEAASEGWQVQAIPYDWRLNDQRLNDQRPDEPGDS